MSSVAPLGTIHVVGRTVKADFMYTTPNSVLEAAASLAIPRQSFRQSSPVRWESIFDSIVARFTDCGRADRTAWLWEHFVEPTASAGPLHEIPEELINGLGATEDRVFLLIEEEGERKKKAFWVFEGSLGAVFSVIGELPMCEFYIAGRKLDWLLANNHHDMWIGAGQQAIDAVRRIKGG